MQALKEKQQYLWKYNLQKIGGNLLITFIPF